MDKKLLPIFILLAVLLIGIVAFIGGRYGSGEKAGDEKAEVAVRAQSGGSGIQGSLSQTAPGQEDSISMPITEVSEQEMAEAVASIESSEIQLSQAEQDAALAEMEAVTTILTPEEQAAVVREFEAGVITTDPEAEPGI